ncbi:VOC family protein [Nocardioides sp. GCM10027113]|uniref:VOC family protein n=1 Tax=unclassified Nocardioides TaxID=2615069 RepID=UPI003622BE7C
MSATHPFWVTAFLDLAADAFEPGVGFWRGVTGYGLSPLRGEHEEFATLVPPRGDDHLRVQQLADGPTRLHLDLHVPDPGTAARAAAGLGATESARPDGPDGYVVMASPGGFPFCFVTHPARVPAGPADWGDGLSSAVDQVCLDVAPDGFHEEVAFWQALTGWELRAPASREEFRRLVRPAEQSVGLLLQRLDEPRGATTAHLDVATTDRFRETARHEALGAEVVATQQWWTVLRDPVGSAYCITDRTPETRVLDEPADH